jgi:urease subunit gamma/beta
VHVTPREQERLLLFTAAELARRRLARGARLGATEAIALVCDEVLEMAWDGVPIEEVVRRAQDVVAADQVLPGVANTVPSLQVEALFPHGTSLVHVPEPFGPGDPAGPGAVLTPDGDIELAPGRPRDEVEMTNAATARCGSPRTSRSRRSTRRWSSTARRSGVSGWTCRRA